MKNIYYLAVLIGLVILSACQNITNFTPERSVIRAIVENAANLGRQVDNNSIRILQRQSFQDKEVLLVTFQGLRKDGIAEECTFVYGATQARGGWEVTGAGGGCGPSGTEKLTINAGSQGGTGQAGISYIFGLVRDSEIRKVEVTWASGEVKTVSVINSSYLALRDGVQSLEISLLEGLDGNDNVLYKFESEQIPTGKQEP